MKHSSRLLCREDRDLRDKDRELRSRWIRQALLSWLSGQCKMRFRKTRFIIKLQLPLLAALPPSSYLLPVQPAATTLSNLCPLSPQPHSGPAVRGGLLGALGSLRRVFCEEEEKATLSNMRRGTQRMMRCPLSRNIFQRRSHKAV